MSLRKKAGSSVFYLFVLLAMCSLSILVHNIIVDTSAAPPYAELGENLAFRVPEFKDAPYEEVNGNLPFFTKEEIEEAQHLGFFESYSELDTLGRCGSAVICLSEKDMPSAPRGDISSVRPTDMINHEYDFLSKNYQNAWLYNRCHLIAYQLSGENANEKNLIAGTQYLNFDGMLPFEKKVMEYLYETKHHVLYRVTPVFAGDNLVATGVLMEARSIEDEGRGLSFCVYCFNVQPGIRIDYRTGENQMR